MTKQVRENRKGLTPLTDSERAKRNADSFNGRMNRLVIGARANAKDKNYTFSINREDMQRIWQNQNGKCTYTGWEMTTKTNDSRLVSIDRIDSSIGYIPSNIQLTCWCVNRAKSFMGENEFREMCKAIAAQSQKNLDF